MVLFQGQQVNSDSSGGSFQSPGLWTSLSLPTPKGLGANEMSVETSVLRRQRGGASSGCLLWVLLIGVFLYLVLQVAPVYLDRFGFQEDLEVLVSQARKENWSDRELQDLILQLGRERKFEVAPADIQIHRSAGRGPLKITAQVTVRRQVQVPGYAYTFTFRTEASSVPSLL